MKMQEYLRNESLKDPVISRLVKLSDRVALLFWKIDLLSLTRHLGGQKKLPVKNIKLM